MTIFNQPIVKQELERIMSLVGTDGERNVLFDCGILKTALIQLDDLLTGTCSHVKVHLNMWEECHHSFDQILHAFGWVVDEKNSRFDCYEWDITKRSGNVEKMLTDFIVNGGGEARDLAPFFFSADEMELFDHLDRSFGPAYCQIINNELVFDFEVVSEPLTPPHNVHIEIEEDLLPFLKQRVNQKLRQLAS